MHLSGRGWQDIFIGAYEKPPAMPGDIYFYPHRCKTLMSGDDMTPYSPAICMLSSSTEPH
ncbi:hypothetical protein KB20921_29730 [Edwardsiella ictaluri]|nr:hypothetical protein KH20906_29620 [Edwardsiella ictaluri]BEI03712.1 hypothetical protein KB20921_29730 [Edwardsiella ictaluri]BEI14119.1 hypothetical protein STU22816_29720 [Edwardsiella ictaluri]BEI17592.1 hypothetical protein STA22820_29650 [Edwardsiella ictaluri]BEI21086.1 hypothetical protein STH22820_29860 [Edwardsiella ictaluri]